MKFEDEAHELAHLYVDGAFSRRDLAKYARKVAGGMAAITAALASMGVPAKADTCPEDMKVPEDAEDIEARDIEFAGDESTLYAHLAMPRREDRSVKIPGVLVIHENRGLVPHIKDVTRRVARAGYVALGIDLLSRAGGTSQIPAQDQNAAYNRLTAAQRLADCRKAVSFLRDHSEVRSNRVGAVGFCAGGGNAWLLATSGEAMTASVSYYGAPVAAADIPKLQGAMLMHSGQRDANFSRMLAAAVPELLTANKIFASHVWEGVGHAFNNDTGAAFNYAVACSAWTQTLDFFARHLNTE